MRKHLLAATVFVAGASPVLANGFGEERPYQFRSPTERNVALIGENTRLSFETQSRGVGSTQGLGGQTGNSLTINISGNGDNVIDVDQDNSGDQSIQDASQGGAIESDDGDLILN